MNNKHVTHLHVFEGKGRMPLKSYSLERNIKKIDLESYPESTHLMRFQLSQQQKNYKCVFVMSSLKGSMMAERQNEMFIIELETSKLQN